MAEMMFPVRQRCKKCRQGLGVNRAQVYLGLYCSPRCAQMAPPINQVADAPRECKTQRDGQWQFKRRYRSESEIPDRMREDPSTNWYWCNNCGSLHVGHSRVKAESLRVVYDGADLADFLVKRRGKATIKDVASAAGVRPIRLKELESGIKHADGIETLFEVAKVLRVEIAMSMKAL